MTASEKSTTWVLVPVKAFEEAKTRLSPAMELSDRARLAKEMATHVVRSAAPMSVAIACDDEDVASWAQAEGATVIWCPGTDLNGAVQQGFAELGAQGVAHVVIAHSDLPFAAGLGHLGAWPGVTLVPDRHGTGTNVMALPTDCDFCFSYGANSFSRHVVEAVRMRRGMRIVHESALSWDIDDPADLLALDSEYRSEGSHGQD